MSETLLAALIAAAATVSASLLQLKSAFSKEIAARTHGGSSRKKSRLPLILIFVLLIASAAGGFSLAKWLNEDERLEQNELQRELEMRIGELGRTAEQLEETRNAARAEIEHGILQRLGEAGVVALAAVGPCKPVAVAGVPTVASDTPTSCTEAEATPVTLCATVPAQAKLIGVELFTRPADASGEWAASRASAGQEIERARFSDTPVESTEADGTKQVCHTFVHWGSDRARSARMLVRYNLPAL